MVCSCSGQCQPVALGVRWKNPVGKTGSWLEQKKWKLWSKASIKQRKKLVVTEGTGLEEKRLLVKSVSQVQKGQWTKWADILPRSVSWSDLWRIPQARLSFIIRATYGTLSSPVNPAWCFGTEEICSLCKAAQGTLHHILVGAKLLWLRASTGGAMTKC